MERNVNRNVSNRRWKLSKLSTCSECDTLHVFLCYCRILYKSLKVTLSQIRCHLKTSGGRSYSVSGDQLNVPSYFFPFSLKIETVWEKKNCIRYWFAFFGPRLWYPAVGLENLFFFIIHVLLKLALNSNLFIRLKMFMHLINRLSQFKANECETVQILNRATFACI